MAGLAKHFIGASLSRFSSLSRVMSAIGSHQMMQYSAMRTLSPRMENNGIMTLELNNIQCKAYLIADMNSKKALIIDPEKGFVDRYLSILGYYGLTLDGVLDTHTHADHISGGDDMHRLTGARYFMHNLSPSPFVSSRVRDGDNVKFGSFNLKVLETPGHTPDSLTYYSPEGKFVYTGDAVLIGGTGRTDFAGGDAGQSFDSITKKIFTLPDDVVMLPGHDYRGFTSSTIGYERDHNPRVTNKSRDEYIAIMKNLGLPLPEKIMESLQVNSAAIELKPGSNPPQYTALAGVRQMSVGQLSQSLSDVVLVDVREPYEVLGFDDNNKFRSSDLAKFESGDIQSYPSYNSNPDAFDNHLALRQKGFYIPVRRLGELYTRLNDVKNKHIVCVCRSGLRSTTAAAMLTALGFPNVSNLAGGHVAWQAYLNSQKK